MISREQTCAACGRVEPEGGLRMTEIGDQVCRMVLACAAEITRQVRGEQTRTGA